jgi:sulfur carrier protein ThiS adenylyltransferase
MMNLKEIHHRLSHFSVGIAGCGGLGSNCAMALIRSGIGKLILADFDVVSESNLNRQFFFRDQIGEKKVVALKNNLLKISPSADVDIHDLRLDPNRIIQLFKKCDVLVEAFDHADQKKMLIETVLEAFPEKPLVIGSGMAGWGRSHLIGIRKMDNLYICGDEQTEVSEELPPLAPRVGIVANMQANTVLEILLEGG